MRRRKDRAGVFEVVIARNSPRLMTDTKPKIQRIEKMPQSHTKASYANYRKIKENEKILKQH